MVRTLDDLRVADLKEELTRRNVQFESKTRKAHLKQLLETTLSEAGFDPTRFDFLTGLQIPSPEKVASTPARPAALKRIDTPAPRRSRRLSNQSSDGESSDVEVRKPVRRKLLKNLESVKEEADIDEPPVPVVAAKTPSRRSRRLSNHNVEVDDTQKALAIPLTLDEKDEKPDDDDKNVENVCCDSGSPIISIVKRPVSITIESDSEEEKTAEKIEADVEQKEETEKSEEKLEDKEEEKNIHAEVENEEPMNEKSDERLENETKEDGIASMINKSFEASKESEVKESIESAMPEQEHLKEGEDENENKIPFQENEADDNEGIQISGELNPEILEALEKTENTRKRKIKWASKKRPSKKKITAFPDDRGMHAMPSSFLDKIDSRCQSAVEFKNKMMGRHDSSRMSQEKSYAQLLKMDKSRRQKEAKQRARKGFFKKQKLESKKTAATKLI